MTESIFFLLTESNEKYKSESHELREKERIRRERERERIRREREIQRQTDSATERQREDCECVLSAAPTAR